MQIFFGHDCSWMDVDDRSNFAFIWDTFYIVRSARRIYWQNSCAGAGPAIVSGVKFTWY